MLKPLILLANSDSTQRQDLKGQLIIHGYEIIEACDRTTTFQAIRNLLPDIVILGSFESSDWDVVKTAQEIRGWNKKVLLILIVNQSSEDLAIAALRAGINEYLKPPCSFEEIHTC